jgi:hypothetical protein
METLVIVLLQLLLCALAIVFVVRRRPHFTLAQLLAGIAVFAAFGVVLFLVLSARSPKGAAGQPQPPAVARHY